MNYFSKQQIYLKNYRCKFKSTMYALSICMNTSGQYNCYVAEITL